MVDPSYGPNSNSVASMQIKAVHSIMTSPSESNQSEDRGHQGLEKRQSGTGATTPDTRKLSVHKELNGEVAILVRAAGMLFKEPAVSLTWNARVDVQSKMDFSAEIEKGSTTVDPVVVGGPINPYTIPGVLDATSKLSINACMDKELRDQAVNLPGLGQADTIANANYKATAAVSLVPQLALQVQVFGTKVISTSIELKPTAEFNYEKAGHGATAGTRDFCVNLKLSAAFQAQILQGMSGQCNVAGSSGKKTVYRS
ncbi:hypothetical protein BASA83_010053 [Batrachochytrium salamandrivorans]|nr:hypothetical protein BASA83_010053 [Batrachochytrium salamandrivorans]